MAPKDENAYIARQEEHHRSRTFREEYVESFSDMTWSLLKGISIDTTSPRPCRGAMDWLFTGLGLPPANFDKPSGFPPHCFVLIQSMDVRSK